VEKSKFYGKPDAKLLFTGHSHVYCFLEAFLANQESPRYRDFSLRYSSDPSSSAPSGEKHWELVLRESVGKTLVFVWNGNQHIARFLFQDDPEIVIYGQKDAVFSPRSSHLASIQKLRSSFEWSFIELVELLNMHHDPTQVLVLGTPPPKRNVFVMDNVMNELYFVNLMKEMGITKEEVRLSKEFFRLRLWQIIQDRLREIANSVGAAFVGVPSFAKDSEGFLLDQFAAADTSHANGAYGDSFYSYLLSTQFGNNK
jgi:hypothetical protein